MKYISHKEIEKSESTEMLPIKIGMYCDNYRECLDIFRKYHDHNNPIVRNAVVLGIGHFIDRFKQYDERILKPILLKLLADKNELVNGNAGVLVGDINSIFKKKLGKSRLTKK